MVDVPVAKAVEAPVTPKGKKDKKTASKAKASHPPAAIMVNSAVKDLNERHGSSLYAIKKYISATYKVDADKLALFIRKAINNNVATGVFVQTKGTGASGRFKLASAVGAAKTKKPAAKPKATKVVAVKKSPAKKAAKPKKSPAKKPTVAAKPISPSKAKKTAKAPTKKPKSPKAKAIKKTKTSPRKK